MANMNEEDVLQHILNDMSSTEQPAPAEDPTAMPPSSQPAPTEGTPAPPPTETRRTKIIRECLESAKMMAQSLQGYARDQTYTVEPRLELKKGKIRYGAKLISHNPSGPPSDHCWLIWDVYPLPS